MQNSENPAQPRQKGQRQQKSKRVAVNGWLILDKPSSLTSTQAVGELKHIYNAKKAGHAGTLDPLATGILPIAFGEATKTVPYVVDGEKSYRFTVRWGIETDTDDSEGTVVSESALRPSRAEIEARLDAFHGEVLQVPPQYSAIKIAGERAYDLARDGEEFEIAARMVQIDRLEIIDMPSADACVFEADCGKGTYVRAIARDLGRALGCLGHISALRRTRVGPFDETTAISLDKLRQFSHSAAGSEELTAVLRPIEVALDDILALPVGSSDAMRLKRGQSVLLRGRDAPIQSGPAYAMSRGMLVAVGDIRHGEFRPTRVFNL